MLEIPANATRLCLQEVDQAVIEDITIFMKNGRKTKVRRKDGRDIETDGSVGCHEASLRASDAKFINVTLSGK